ncbi:GNAT family N-acetyltransferase [Sphingomonas bacterium]|uniref:GNAT family N-acetyltransferase n=1 Tax=Sphingomonas bacterium TaxID=1895847 RepID=UPI00157763C8|nr:GNAT family N-acetyltransferase [Sphingomonas bacterium]
MFARTPRLFLRPGWPEDAAAVAAAINHQAVAHRLENVPFPYHANDAVEWLARPHDPCAASMLVVSHEGEQPAIIGVVSLIPRDGELMLGYWYTPPAWGRGYATEAGRAAVDIARHSLGARRLGSRYHADNPASANVLRKLGFRETGMRRPVLSRARGYAVEAVVMELDLTSETTWRRAA